MTSEQIVALIQWLTIAVGACITFYKGLDRYLKFLENKKKEESVGATKIIELIAADRELQAEIDKLQDVDEKHREEIHDLKGKHEKLMDHIWNYMGKK